MSSRVAMSEEPVMASVVDPQSHPWLILFLVISLAMNGLNLLLNLRSIQEDHSQVESYSSQIGDLQRHNAKR